MHVGGLGWEMGCVWKGEGERFLTSLREGVSVCLMNACASAFRVVVCTCMCRVHFDRALMRTCVACSVMCPFC